MSLLIAPMIRKFASWSLSIFFFLVWYFESDFGDKYAGFDRLYSGQGNEGITMDTSWMLLREVDIRILNLVDVDNLITTAAMFHVELEASTVLIQTNLRHPILAQTTSRRDCPSPGSVRFQGEISPGVYSLGC